MINQNKLIKSYLESGKTITHYEALELFGCFRLASRMHDLKSEGYPFEKEMIITDSGKRIAQYKKAPSGGTLEAS